MHRIITFASALAVTGLAVALAVASSTSRAAGGHAAVLLAGLSAAIVLAVHLAPALLSSVPRLVLWPVWALSLAGALWAHLGFFSATAAESAAARLASSPSTAAAAQQRADIRAAINQIKARSTAQIARQLSWTNDTDRTAVLQAELQQAQRRDQLQDQLLALSAAATATAATATVDPVSVMLAVAIGVSADSVQLAAGVLLALLLEVLGMLMWREALKPDDRSTDRSQIIPMDVHQHAQHTESAAAPQAQAAVQQILQVNVQQPAPAASQHVQSDAPELVQTGIHQTAPLLFDASVDDVSRLRAAIRAGHCVPTVAGIRTYLRCSQVKARELRRSLDDAMLVS